MMLQFEKDTENNWFIALPDYPGSHADLQMVSGADTLLNQLDIGDTGSIKIAVNTMPSNDDFKLKLMFKLLGGGLYRCVSPLKVSTVWLCKVVKYVFDGELPKTLYCSLA